MVWFECQSGMIWVAEWFGLSGSVVLSEWQCISLWSRVVWYGWQSGLIWVAEWFDLSGRVVWSEWQSGLV